MTILRIASPELPAATQPTPGARLMRLARDLGATSAGGELDPLEAVFLRVGEDLPPTGPAVLEQVRRLILAGEDPLGEKLLGWRSAKERRPDGAFYTPPALIKPMVEWTLAQDVARVVDAGCGSGRFAAAVARRRPDLELVAIDTDPMATLLTRAALAVLGHERGRVVLGSYLSVQVPELPGRTAWIGNPPYVRHHDLDPDVKRWATVAGARLGHPVSSLSGLHAYFFLATALHAGPGDVGTFVTSAEWLDVGYGALIRQLLMNGLGLESLHVLDPKAVPFRGCHDHGRDCVLPGRRPAGARVLGAALTFTWAELP